MRHSSSSARIAKVAAAWLAVAVTAHAQLPAFPGADGAGRLVTGGRGGSVYHVTSLAGKYNDANRAAYGTLAYGLADANFTVNGVVQPRTIVFDVGGTIDLSSLDDVVAPQAPSATVWDELPLEPVSSTQVGQQCAWPRRWLSFGPP